jgi:hypothetical protein
VDEYRITEVGVTALRWRRRWVCNLQDLLERLAGRPLALTDARGEFADIAMHTCPACERR